MSIKVSVYIAVSLDGFIARENGELDWLPGANPETETVTGAQNGNAEDYGYGNFFSSVDALVMGRKTFEFVQKVTPWPYGEKPVYVLSHNLKQTEISQPTIRVLSGSPSEILAKLKSGGMQHVYLDGGKTIQEFLRAGLVDSLTITRVPVLIGRGIPLFGNVSADIHFEHTRTRSFASGFVQSQYYIKK